MQVYVEGGTARQRALATSIAHFCHQMLMPRMKTLEINIEFNDDMRQDDDCGYCVPTAGYVCKSPREFDIEINASKSLRTIMDTVAHEMVHVKQYARNELRELGDSHFTWLGESVDGNKINYFDLPWEIEAHGREEGLFRRWAEQEGYKNEKWTKSN